PPGTVAPLHGRRRRGARRSAAEHLRRRPGARAAHPRGVVVIASIASGSDALVQIAPGQSPPPRTADPPARPRRVAVSERMDRPATGVTVRAARISDMRQVQTLVNGFARDNLMLPKTYDQLARLFREFVVAVDSTDRVLGCGALRIYSEDLAEIASLAVDESMHGAGIGRRLVERLTGEARELGLG